MNGVTSFLRSLAADLRERHVLPAVVLLALLAIGIPVYATAALSKSPTPATINPAPVDATPPHGTPAPGQALVLVQTPQSQHYTVYKGHERNPFATTASSSSAKPSKTSSSPTASTPVSTPSKTITPNVPHPSSTAPKSESAPAKLSDKQVYTINGVSTYGSEKDTLNDIERLTPLPANATEMVYLGVVKGGKYAAFELGGVPISGITHHSAICVPSDGDCQVIELPVGRKLTLRAASSSISTFTFELKSISAKKFTSNSAATAAREAASTLGEAILAKLSSVGLGAFVYKVDSGVVVYEPQAPTTGASGATGTSGTSGASGTTGSTS
ncbi:MAG TPA: hypothetical protein VHM72_06530 [Solirubrobacteraceae bacterium]|jgi:hypothetical protein|nr:hypothetical protein [Solirubrobacteraceae bacterium]